MGGYVTDIDIATILIFLAGSVVLLIASSYWWFILMTDQKKLNETSSSNLPKYTDKPISGTDKITPITQQPVEEITANEWEKMTPTELHNQLLILQRRYWMADEMKLLDVTKQIQRGIDDILHLLQKNKVNETLI